MEALVHMARRRCLDDKAAVRKAGVQLLEALLLMRAKGLGGAPPELPCEQDIRALEAATADALVGLPECVSAGPETVAVEGDADFDQGQRKRGDGFISAQGFSLTLQILGGYCCSLWLWPVVVCRLAEMLHNSVSSVNRSERPYACRL